MREKIPSPRGRPFHEGKGLGVRSSLRLLIALVTTVLASLLPAPATLHAESGAEADTASASAWPQVVKVPDRAALWLIEPDGQRRWLADRQSLQTQGLNTNDVVLVSPSWLRQWPVGPALLTGSLWQDRQSGRVYLVADGRRRWIPDLLTFRRLGLAWSQVRPATSTELQGVPAGPALPWIVTGWASPSETAGPLPYLGAAPHRFAPEPEPEPEQRTVDPRFLPALELMRSFAPTSQWPDFLERAGVSLIVEEDDRSLLPQYSDLNNIIAFGAGFVEGESDDSLAAALIKQTVHAIFFHRYWHEISGRSCIREQAIAFGWEAIFWASRHGLAGQPGETTALADLHNLTLEWALDDRLDGALLAHFGYQVNCYFPGAFQSIDEEGSDYGTLY